jgi:AcrR family transcriptional regulator
LTASRKVSIVYFVAEPRKKPRRKAPARYHHGDLRRALLDAALDAIARGGLEAVNLRDLARRLGVSPAAPYRHFPDRDALLVALTGEIARAQAAAPPDALSQYRAVGIAQVLFAVEHPAQFRAMFHPGVADRVVSGDLAEGHDALRAALTEAQRAGQLASLPVDDMMLAASSLTYGLARRIVDGDPAFAGLTRARAEQLAIAVTEVLGCGLAPR